MVAKSQASFRVVISGYYGFRNSGDEAVLKSILDALAAQSQLLGVQVQPVVLSIDPPLTASMYGVEAVHRMQPKAIMQAIRSSDGLISGGGSLLQDATGVKSIPYYTGVVQLARWLGKPTYIYAQGIGPVFRSWLKPFVKAAMRKSAYVSVRDPQSAELLASYGVDRGKVHIVPDPVLGLVPGAAGQQRAAGAAGQAGTGAGYSAEVGGSAGTEAGANRGEKLPVVGVSVRFWREDRRELDEVAAALASLAAARPVRIRMLPFHMPEDVEASRYVMAGLEGKLAGSELELVQPGEHPEEMLLEIGRCDALLGMRLHALIYAANRLVPMLGLSYDPKIDQFLKLLGLEPVGSTEMLDSARCASELQQLLDHAEGWRQAHREQIDKLKQQSQLPAQHIIAHLRQIRQG